MTYYAQEEDYEILFQSKIIMYARIELLNENMQIIDSLEGKVLSGSNSIDSLSEIRSTYEISLIVNDKSFNIGEQNKIWYKKYVRIYEGYYNLKRNKIVWYLNGTYLFNETNYTFNASMSELSISCLDLTALTNGTRNGYTKGQTVKILEGERIRDVLASLITQECGLKRYRIEENVAYIPSYLEAYVAPCNQIPYDLEFTFTDTVWTKITKILEFYTGWEAFFDIDGTFIFQPVPTCEDDEPILKAEIMERLVLEEPTTASFSEIANVTDLYGKLIDSDRFTSACTASNSNYDMKIDDSSFDGDKIPNNTKIEVVVSASSVKGQTMSFNGKKKYKICIENGTEIEEKRMMPNVNYILKYSNNILVFLGEYQVHAICKQLAFIPTEQQIIEDKIRENCNNIKYIINPDSPYAIKQMWVGEIRNPLSGNEYDSIYSDELALQRAEYENNRKTRIVQTITFSMRDVPWLTVNQKIEYKSKRTGETKQYIVKSISRVSLSGLATVACEEFYPLYPFT